MNYNSFTNTLPKQTRVFYLLNIILEFNSINQNKIMYNIKSILFIYFSIYYIIYKSYIYFFNVFHTE